MQLPTNAICILFFTIHFWLIKKSHKNVSYYMFFNIRQSITQAITVYHDFFRTTNRKATSFDLTSLSQSAVPFYRSLHWSSKVRSKYSGCSQYSFPEPESLLVIFISSLGYSDGRLSYNKRDQPTSTFLESISSFRTDT